MERFSSAGFEAPAIRFPELSLDLDLDTCGKLDAHKSLYSLLAGIKNVDKSLVGSHFELLAAVLVLVNSSEDRNDLLVSRKRNRTAHLATVSLCNVICWVTTISCTGRSM